MWVKWGPSCSRQEGVWICGYLSPSLDCKFPESRDLSPFSVIVLVQWSSTALGPQKGPDRYLLDEQMNEGRKEREKG